MGYMERLCAYMFEEGGRSQEKEKTPNQSGEPRDEEVKHKATEVAKIFKTTEGTKRKTSPMVTVQADDQRTKEKSEEREVGGGTTEG
jgi:hypothetical protein